MTDLGAQYLAKWDGLQVVGTREPNGQEWVRADFFVEAMNDIKTLAEELTKATKARTNAQRKAKKAKKKIQGSPGDTPAKGVAEQALYRTVGANARSDSNKRTTQSQSVSVPPGGADEASNRVAVGQTSGSSDIADANGSADVEGRQSLHLTTSETARSVRRYAAS